MALSSGSSSSSTELQVWAALGQSRTVRLAQDFNMVIHLVMAHSWMAQLWHMFRQILFPLSWKYIFEVFWWSLFQNVGILTPDFFFPKYSWLKMSFFGGIYCMVWIECLHTIHSCWCVFKHLDVSFLVLYRLKLWGIQTQLQGRHNTTCIVLYSVKKLFFYRCDTIDIVHYNSDACKGDDSKTQLSWVDLLKGAFRP